MNTGSGASRFSQPSKHEFGIKKLRRHHEEELLSIASLHPIELVLRLTISARAIDTEKVLFNFQGGAYGYGGGNIVRDATGTFYGTLGTSPSKTCVRFCGVVYKLTPTANGNTETIIHTFTGGADGEEPDGMVMDAKGNIFVSTYAGASTKCFGGCGAIVEPFAHQEWWIQHDDCLRFRQRNRWW
jgi:hypothetical protein